MKFTIDKEALGTALDRVRSVAKPGSIPILGHVAIWAGGQSLTLAGTDLTIEATARVDAYVQQEGATTIDAGRLADICRRLPEGAEIDFSLAESRATIRAGMSRFSLSTLPIGDFPRMAPPEQGAALVMKAGGLARVLKIGGGCTGGGKEVRTYFLATFVRSAGDKINAISTDSRRIVLADAPRPDDFHLPDGMMIPNRTNALMVDALGAMPPDDLARVVFGQQIIAADMGALSIVSKIIDGTYPISAIDTFVKPKRDSLAVDADLIIGAVRRLMIVDDSVQMVLHHDRIEFVARSFETGEATDQVPCDWKGESGRQLRFDGRYLLHFLELVTTESVIFEVAAGAGEPMNIHGTGDRDWIGVLMPIVGSK